MLKETHTAIHHLRKKYRYLSVFFNKDLFFFIPHSLSERHVIIYPVFNSCSYFWHTISFRIGFKIMQWSFYLVLINFKFLVRYCDVLFDNYKYWHDSWKFLVSILLLLPKCYWLKQRSHYHNSQRNRYRGLITVKL